MPGTMPSEGCRRPAWRKAQDEEGYTETTTGTHEQPIMLEDSDEAINENDGFADIDDFTDVIPKTQPPKPPRFTTYPSPLASRLHIQDMFPDNPGIRALVGMTDSQLGAIYIDTQSSLFEDLMSTMQPQLQASGGGGGGGGVDVDAESTESD
jgi:hypothetical protein